MFDAIRAWRRWDGDSGFMVPDESWEFPGPGRIVQDDDRGWPDLAAAQRMCNGHYCSGYCRPSACDVWVAQAVVAYALDAYGRERLPALLAGFGRHATWGEVAPAVLGVPVAEFEAGWQAYLAGREP
jgi:hypothetical protein